MEKCKYYQLVTKGDTAELSIYGDITSDAAVIRKVFGEEASVVSANDIKKELANLKVKTINVFINSYGGEVAEALAIYTALKRHSAKIHTFCDGFACSAASIIFCAGSQRTMGTLSLLMIHNCFMYVGAANADQMRKMADDADKINQSSIEAYKSVTGLPEKQIKKLMDAETWFTAEEAVKYKFATDIAEIDRDPDNPQQSGFKAIRQSILQSRGQDPAHDLGDKGYPDTMLNRMRVAHGVKPYKKMK